MKVRKLFFRHDKLHLGVLASTMMTVFGSGSGPNMVFGQEELEEITVTGSRIVRRDFEANSPVMTVDEDLFENTGTIGIETVMNQLPQFVPAVTQFNTSEVQASATNTPGASTVSLRGLGSNRNLVLLDGRRAMPINASGAVDINMIPSSALQRVETISGGASSTYGADAMAGVVNFILKRDYEGFELDMQYGLTAEGDGEQERLSGLFGANFGDGRGNVLLGFEGTRRGEVQRADRAFYRDGWADPSTAGTDTRISASVYNVNTANRPTQAAYQSIFTGEVPAAGPTGAFHWNDDMSLYRVAPDGSYRYNGPLTDADGNVFRKIRTDGSLVQNQTDALISIPMERYSVFGKAVFDINDDVTAFFQTTFSQNTNRTTLLYSPAVGNWSTLIPYGTEAYAPSLDANGNTLLAYQAGGQFGLNCGPVGGCTNSEAFPVPPELATLLNSRPNPDEYWQMGHVLEWAGPRRTENRVTSYQMTFGFEGSLPIQDWTWEAYGSYGSTQVQTEMLGFGALERFRAVAGSPNYGRGFFYTGNSHVGGEIDAAFGGGFGGGLARCTTGMPIFEKFMPSQDCYDAVTANMQNSSTMEQTVGEFNTQGLLLTLPAGEMRFAAGASYRENEYSYLTDILMSQNSFLDSAMGVFPGSNSNGRIKSRDIYGELLIPVVSGLPLMQSLNLEVGYRYTNNDPSPNVNTWKALFDWSMTDSIRLRGGWQEANRAPNIGELFLSRTQSLTQTTDGDYCSELNPVNPLSANPDRNPNAAQVKALCSELMGTQGAEEYYAPDNNQPNTSGGNSFINLVGNPDLTNETASTFTAGAVVTLTNDLSVTVDWYDIEIENMISAENASAVYRQCMDPALNPTYDADYVACNRLVRDPNSGAAAPTDVGYTNQGALRTQGVDLQVNWGTEFWNGNISASFMTSYLHKIETRVNAVAPWRDWVGTFGPNDLTGVNGGSFEYRTFTTLNYFDNAGWNTTLRWRHLPPIDSAQAVAGATTISPTGRYDIFDFSGGYRFGEDATYMLRFGIDNLFDAQPEITNRNLAADIPNSGHGTTQANFYDVLGRNYWLGLKMEF